MIETDLMSKMKASFIRSWLSLRRQHGISCNESSFTRGIYDWQYVRWLNIKAIGCWLSLLMAILIYFNYTAGIESTIMEQGLRPAPACWFFCLYLFVFGSAWLLQSALREYKYGRPPLFFYVLLLAGLPASLPSKCRPTELSPACSRQVLSFPWDHYGYMVLNWPAEMRCWYLVAGDDCMACWQI